EVARRLRRLRSDAEATFEYHFLNGLQGVVKDPKDGATVVEYFTEFAITPAADRGGSVCLNTVRGVSKWMSRPLQAAAGIGVARLMYA
ncbi:MAG: major capsid protein, partial [Rhodanobacteraceae bacterium]